MVLERRIDALNAELVRFAERKVPGRGEELVQETWLRMHRAQPTCPDDGSFRAYAYAVVRRLIIDHYRRRANRVNLVPIEGGIPLSGPADPHGTAVAGQVLQVVEAELADMKPAIAEVFRWRMTEEWSFSDIACKQGVSINTALGRMHQATKRLARALRSRDLMEEG